MQRTMLSLSTILFVAACGPTAPKTDSDAGNEGPKACQSDTDCAPQAMCSSNTCVIRPDACYKDTDCTNQQTCTNGRCTRRPDACDKDTDCGKKYYCPSGLCIIRPNACAADGSCPAKSFCVDELCVPDDQPPTLTVDQPTEGQVISAGKFTVSGSADDGTGAGGVTVSLAVGTQAAQPLAVTAGKFTTEVDAPLLDGASLALKLHASDRLSNSVDKTVAVIVDRVPPQITLSQPPKTSYNASDSGRSIDITGTVTDGSGKIKSVELSTDEGVTWIPSGTTATFKYTYVIPGAANSRFVLQVRATDDAGNQSAAVSSQPIIVDSLPPVVHITSPSAGAVFSLASPNTVSVTGDVVETNLATLKYHLDSGTDQDVAVANGQYSFTVQLSDTDDAVTHLLTFTAADLAGNTGNANVSYIVDRVPPHLAITAPATDGSCDSTSCIGPVVNSLTSTLAFSGTYSDGGGLKSTGGLTAQVDLKTSVTQLPPVLANGTWSANWTLFPSNPGAAYTFTVQATDAAGNSSTANRQVWLDNVAPTATALVNNQRLLPRGSALVQFSEPMNLSTVRTAARVNGVSLGTSSSFGTLDTAKTKYGFATASELTAYSSTQFSISTAATDTAGNALAAPVSERFLTEAIPASPSVAVATSGSDPRLAIDSDGLPAVAYWNGTAFAVALWDGRSAYRTATIPLPPTATYNGASVGYSLSSPKPTELRISDSQNTDLTLSHTAMLVGIGAATLNTATQPSPPLSLVFYAQSKDNLVTWTGLSGTGAADVVGAATGGADPMLLDTCTSVLHGTLPLGYYTLDCAASAVIFRSYNSTNLVRQDFSTSTKTWAAGTSILLTPSGTLRGSHQGGALATNPIYLPTATATTATYTAITPSAVAGLTSSKDVTGTGFVVDKGSGYLAWNGGGLACTGISGTGTLEEVYLACGSPPSGAGNWKQSTVFTHCSTSGSAKPSSVDLARTGTTVGFAIGLANYTVQYGTLTDGTCSTAPAVSWASASIVGAKTPAIAIAPDGTAHVAYVNSGTNAVAVGP